MIFTGFYVDYYHIVVSYFIPRFVNKLFCRAYYKAFPVSAYKMILRRIIHM